MRKLQTIKGSLGVFALAFAASLLLLLPGCQGPFGPDREAGTGTVSLTIEMPPLERAILPTLGLTDIYNFRLVFENGNGEESFTVDGGTPTVTGTFALPVGNDWILTVTAYLDSANYTANDYVLTGSSEPFNVTAGASVTVPPVLLGPGDLPGGALGRFNWDITLPPGAKGTMTVTAVDGTAQDTPEPLAAPRAEGGMDLAPGRYNVLINLTMGGQVASLSRVLHVLPYNLMPSVFVHEFEVSHFRALIESTLGTFISRTGNWWTDDNQPGWIGTEIEEGEFSPGAELHLAGVDAAEWVNNGGALALRVTGRAARGHGVDLRVGGLGLVAGDTITVTGRAIGPAVTPDGSPGRVIAANVNLGGWEPIGQSNNLGAGVLDHAAFTLTANFAGQATEAVRIQTNTWEVAGAPANDGIHTFYIDRIEINRIIPFSAPLSDIVSFTGLLADVERPTWYTTDMSAGAALIAPFSIGGGGAGAWVEHNDRLAASITGRGANYHGIEFSLAGISLAAGDRVIISGYVYAEAGSADGGWRRMELQGQPNNTELPASHPRVPNDGLNHFELTWILGDATPPANIRLMGNGPAPAPAGLTRFFIYDVEINRPAVAAITGYLGEFISLTGGMPTNLAWQGVTITENSPLVNPFPNDLIRDAGAVLTWRNVDGNLALEVLRSPVDTPNTDNWRGVDLRIANLGFSATGVYTMTIEGTLGTDASTTARMTVASQGGTSGWSLVVPTDVYPGADGAFTLVTEPFSRDNLGEVADFRINTAGAGGMNFIITGIVFERVDVVCSDCGQFPSVCCPVCHNPPDDCTCVVPPHVERLNMGMPVPINLNTLRNAAEDTGIGSIAFDMQASGFDAAEHFTPGAVAGSTVSPFMVGDQLIVVGHGFTHHDGNLMIILPPDVFGSYAGVGYFLHVTGRLYPTAASGVGNINLRQPGGGNPVQINGANNHLTNPITITGRRLSPTDIANGLAININFWSWNGDGDNPTMASQDFVFSIDDMLIIVGENCPDCNLDPCVCHAGPECDLCDDDGCWECLGYRLPGTPANLDTIRADGNLTSIFDIRDLNATQALAHFNGHGTVNRGTVFTHDLGGQIIGYVTDFGRRGVAGAGAHNPNQMGWSPIAILTANQANLQPGDTVHIRGRFGPDGFVFSGGSATDLTGNNNSRGIRRGFTGNTFVDTTALTFAPGPFSVDIVLTPEDIAAGLTISWHMWGGLDTAIQAGDSDFTISIDDLMVTRGGP